jgi:hypothetical protein
MRTLPKLRSRQSATVRCEMQMHSSVLMPVRYRPPHTAVGRRDCPQTCPHFRRPAGEMALEAMDSVGVDTALVFARQAYIDSCIDRYRTDSVASLPVDERLDRGQADDRLCARSPG